VYRWEHDKDVYGWCCDPVNANTELVTSFDVAPPDETEMVCVVV
jgi:hypothetical protein